ncbi:reverse transcriptase domain-containing protein [Tanacetum coccineum]
MPPRMTTRSAGRSTAAPRGGRTGRRTGRGGRRIGEPRGRGDGQISKPNIQGVEVNGGFDGVLNFSTIIAQQLQNRLPTILAQVGNQGNDQGINRNQNGGAVNDNIQGDGGVIVYAHWIKKMESVQDTSGCGNDQKIRTQSREAAVGISWEDFKKLTREEFCLVNEMQKLETEFWNHAMVGVGHAAYTDRYHELARLLPHLVTPENRRIERYIYGLAPHIQGMVAATEPTIIQKAV